MWVLQPVKWGRGREGDLKNVRTSGKILATLLISHSAFAICFSAVNICIWSFLAWFSRVRISYKHDDFGYSQESNCSFVVKYPWPCWYLFVTAKNLFMLTGWSFRTTKFFDQPSLLSDFLYVPRLIFTHWNTRVFQPVASLPDATSVSTTSEASNERSGSVSVWLAKTVCPAKLHIRDFVLWQF